MIIIRKGDRIFHSSEIWQENDTEICILVVFGRSNPSKIFNSIVKVRVSVESEEILSIETVKESNELAR